MSADSNDAIILLPHDQLVSKIAKDLYFGNGKPALTVRIALQEENMEQVQSDIGEIKDNQKSFNRLLLGTLISSIGGVLLVGVEVILKLAGK